MPSTYEKGDTGCIETSGMGTSEYKHRHTDSVRPGMVYRAVKQKSAN